MINLMILPLLYSKLAVVAIDNAFILYVNGPGFDSRRQKHSFLSFIFWSFCLFCVFFVKHFHFLTNLKYTGRLIAVSLSAFLSKIQ